MQRNCEVDRERTRQRKAAAAIAAAVAGADCGCSCRRWQRRRAHRVSEPRRGVPSGPRPTRPPAAAPRTRCAVSGPPGDGRLTRHKEAYGQVC